MKSTYAGMLALCLIATAAPAAAQQMPWSDKISVSVDGGYQAGSHDLSSSTSPTIYDEAATITGAQKAKGGGFFDIGVGYKWRPHLGAAITYSHVSSKSDASVNGTIPDPIFYDRQRPFSATLSGAKHTENAVNLDAVYLYPVTDKIEVSGFAGPTIFRVKQDLLSSNVVVSENPFAVQTPTVSAGKTTVGINLGMDVTYMITDQVGVGGVARYSWGSVNLSGASKKLTVGGFQIGAGARLRF